MVCIKSLWLLEKYYDWVTYDVVVPVGEDHNQWANLSDFVDIYKFSMRQNVSVSGKQIALWREIEALTLGNGNFEQWI